MTKNGILGLLCLVLVVLELMTNFSSNTVHFLLGMALLISLNQGE